MKAKVHVVKIGDLENAYALLGEDFVEIGRVANVTYREALDAFAANWPEYHVELDALAEVDRELCGDALEGRRRVSRPATGKRARGSGARFRELFAEGKTNAEALAIIRAEFPDSRATLSDAAWNRNKLQKETAAREGGRSGGVEDLL